jgi:hypothetical protein
MELFIHESYQSMPNYKVKHVTLHFGTVPKLFQTNTMIRADVSSSIPYIDRTGTARGFVVRGDAFASEKHMKL